MPAYYQRDNVYLFSRVATSAGSWSFQEMFSSGADVATDQRNGALLSLQVS